MDTLIPVWIVQPSGRIITGRISRELAQSGILANSQGINIPLCIDEKWQIAQEEIVGVKDIWVKMNIGGHRDSN